MTETTYEVQVWKVVPRKNARGKVTSYRLRWRVGSKEHRKQFKTSALAESFRSQLVTAASKGEAFMVHEPGFPVSMARPSEPMTWFKFVCLYVDMKWPQSSPGHRKSTADSLVAITTAMFATDAGKPEQKVLNRALRTAFSRRARREPQDDEIERALRWVSGHTRQVNELASPGVLRGVLADLELNQNGERAASNTIRLRRTTLRNAIDYAIEKKLLATNPLEEVKVKRHSTTLKQVDRRSVVNPAQARKLLKAVRQHNPRLEAFFGLLYYAALRPEEATNFSTESMAAVPEKGWGELYIDKATPEVGGQWSDAGIRSEARSLKHRDDNVGRSVPCPPPLTALLHQHIAKHGTAPDGRLFAGVRNGGRLGSSVYGRVWAQSRADVFAPDVLDSPLAKRPYDLRHAAVSTWLNAGVEATRVAEWAGHSVHVLLRVYAKCLDGGEQIARQRVHDLLEQD